MDLPVRVDDQPMDAGFFHEGRWLTSFITPNDLEIELLYEEITRGITDQRERLAALHQWVAGKIKYKPTIQGQLWIEGHSSFQKDLWMQPALTKRVMVGNCSNKSFLLTSLIRRELGPESVFCVLGNLYNGTASGHAWLQISLDNEMYIMESTQSLVPSLVPVEKATRYEVVHLFNDQNVYAIPGKTVLEPFKACYSTWLKDYLDWSYINGAK